jgi:hypothetical protein
MSDPSKAQSRLVVTVGNEFFGLGLTRLELDNTGSVVITNRLEKDEKQIESRLDAAQANGLLDQAEAEMRGKTGLGERRGLPDEPRYHIEVHRGGQIVETITVWRSELVEHRELSALLRQLQGIVNKATDGTIVL